MLLASLRAITVSRGPKLREKCLNLCPPLPAVHPLFSLASSLSFDARRGELNRSWLPLFSSLEIICGYPLSSFASSTFPSLPLFSPLFIIIRFYRASRPETTIKRVGTLCSFDSVGGQFARHFPPPPLPPSSTLFSLFARAYRTPRSCSSCALGRGPLPFQPGVSDPVLDEIGISRKEEGKRLFSFETIFFLSSSFYFFFR